MRITNASRFPFPGYSENEIQRQNRITQRIIANFLERRLFPFRRPQNDVPTIDEILPVPAKDPPSDGDGGGRGKAGARKRFRPKSTYDLLKGGPRKGFKPSNPKYSAPNNNSDETSQSTDDQTRNEEQVEDYYEEDYTDGGNEGDHLNYDNYDDGEAEANGGGSREANNTLDLLNGDRGLFGAGAVLGDYDDTESLQTVESEHFNLFYRNHNKRFNQRFNVDDDYYEGRCCSSCYYDLLS